MGDRGCNVERANYVEGTDYIALEDGLISPLAFQERCKKDFRCTGIVFNKDHTSCLLWLGHMCDTRMGDENDGWEVMIGYTTCDAVGKVGCADFGTDVVEKLV